MYQSGAKVPTSSGRSENYAALALERIKQDLDLHKCESLQKVGINFKSSTTTREDYSEYTKSSLESSSSLAFNNLNNKGNSSSTTSKLIRKPSIERDIPCIQFHRGSPALDSGAGSSRSGSPHSQQFQNSRLSIGQINSSPCLSSYSDVPPLPPPRNSSTPPTQSPTTINLQILKRRSPASSAKQITLTATVEAQPTSQRQVSSHLTAQSGQKVQQQFSQVQTLNLYQTTGNSVEPPPPYPINGCVGQIPPPSYSVSIQNRNSPTQSQSDYRKSPSSGIYSATSAGSASPINVSNNGIVPNITQISMPGTSSTMVRPQPWGAYQTRTQPPIIMQSVKSTHVQKPILQNATAPPPPSSPVFVTPVNVTNTLPPYSQLQQKTQSSHISKKTSLISSTSTDSPTPTINLKIITPPTTSPVLISSIVHTSASSNSSSVPIKEPPSYAITIQAMKAAQNQQHTQNKKAEKGCTTNHSLPPPPPYLFLNGCSNILDTKNSINSNTNSINNKYDYIIDSSNSNNNYSNPNNEDAISRNNDTYSEENTSLNNYDNNCLHIMNISKTSFNDTSNLMKIDNNIYTNSDSNNNQNACYIKNDHIDNLINNNKIINKIDNDVSNKVNTYTNNIYNNYSNNSNGNQSNDRINNDNIYTNSNYDINSRKENININNKSNNTNIENSNHHCFLIDDKNRHNVDSSCTDHNNEGYNDINKPGGSGKNNYDYINTNDGVNMRNNVTSDNSLQNNKYKIVNGYASVDAKNIDMNTYINRDSNNIKQTNNCANRNLKIINEKEKNNKNVGKKKNDDSRNTIINSIFDNGCLNNSITDIITSTLTPNISLPIISLPNSEKSKISAVNNNNNNNNNNNDNIRKIKHQSPIPERKKVSKEKEEERKEFRIKHYSPQAFKFFMEQHIENVMKSYKQRSFRANQLEKEMAKINLSAQAQVQMRLMLNQKESNYIRLKRAKMDKSMFVQIKHIGVGAFGEVSLVKKLDATNHLYAMKTLRKADVLKRNQVAHVKAERDILAEADNEWVVKLYYSFQDKDNLYFVMDYIPGGDLMSLLIKKGVFEETLARFYIAELTCAVESVHKMGFIHRDIKPDNILIDRDGHIKLTDFGLCTGFRWTHNSKYYQENIDHCRQDSMEPWEDYSGNATKPTVLERRRIREHQRTLAHSLVGTPNYIAPEVLERSGYTQLCDWWSVGVILYEMLVGQPPFLANTPVETQQKVINWEKTLVIPPQSELSREAADLIKKLCSAADKRLGKNADEVKQHQYFKVVDWLDMRKQKAPYIPKIEHPTDTSNFDPIDPDKLRNSRDSNSGDPNDDTTKPFHGFFEFTFRRFFDSDLNKFQKTNADYNDDQGPVYV